MQEKNLIMLKNTSSKFHCSMHEYKHANFYEDRGRFCRLLQEWLKTNMSQISMRTSRTVIVRAPKPESPSRKEV